MGDKLENTLGNTMENHHDMQRNPSACISEYGTDVRFSTDGLLRVDEGRNGQTFDEHETNTGSYNPGTPGFTQLEGSRGGDYFPAANVNVEPVNTVLDNPGKMNPEQQFQGRQNGRPFDAKGSFLAIPSFDFTAPLSGTYPMNGLPLQFGQPLQGYHAQSPQTLYDESSRTLNRNPDVQFGALVDPGLSPYYDQSLGAPYRNSMPPLGSYSDRSPPNLYDRSSGPSNRNSMPQLGVYNEQNPSNIYDHSFEVSNGSSIAVEAYNDQSSQPYYLQSLGQSNRNSMVSGSYDIQSPLALYDQSSGVSNGNSAITGVYNAGGISGYTPVDTNPAYANTICPWVTSDQVCNVSMPDLSALEQHIQTDHIQLQTVDHTPYADFTEDLEPRQVTTDVIHDHQDGLGVAGVTCMINDCGEWFDSSENLAHHAGVVHRSFACHWAGCQKTTTSQSELENHVHIDHLSLDPLESLEEGITMDPMASAEFTPPTSILKEPAHQKPAQEKSAQEKPAQRKSAQRKPAQEKSAQKQPVQRKPPQRKSAQKQPAKENICRWEVDPQSRQLCNAQFPTGNDLQAHVGSDHIKERGVVICKWRGCKRNREPLKTKEKLKRHIYSHTGFWSCACKYSNCGKTFNCKESLDVHMRTHTGEKPFICKLCQQGFAADSALTNHIRIHTKDKIFRCTGCLFCCTDGSNFSKHKLIHGEHNFICDICDRGFHRSSGLDRHMKVHDPNRPDRRKRKIAAISE